MVNLSMSKNRIWGNFLTKIPFSIIPSIVGFNASNLFIRILTQNFLDYSDFLFGWGGQVASHWFCHEVN
jgi:hypothetical protein